MAHDAGDGGARGGVRLNMQEKVAGVWTSHKENVGPALTIFPTSIKFSYNYNMSSTPPFLWENV